MPMWPRNAPFLRFVVAFTLLHSLSDHLLQTKQINSSSSSSSSSNNNNEHNKKRTSKKAKTPTQPPTHASTHARTHTQTERAKEKQKATRSEKGRLYLSLRHSRSTDRDRESIEREYREKVARESDRERSSEFEFGVQSLTPSLSLPHSLTHSLAPLPEGSNGRHSRLQEIRKTIDIT